MNTIINQSSRIHSKTLVHIEITHKELKTYKEIDLITGAIKLYCNLFKITTGVELFYKQVKGSRYKISLNPMQ